MTTKYLNYAMTMFIFFFLGCETETVVEPNVITTDESFNLVESTIQEMQTAMNEGHLTAQGLVQQYLTRIALYENLLNATISVNPNAMTVAEQLDRERAEGQVRGPLHGIPIALKDNIHTIDMPTTGGARAFA